jgi:iron complex outermembrane receptor protein
MNMKSTPDSVSPASQLPRVLALAAACGLLAAGAAGAPLAPAARDASFPSGGDDIIKLATINVTAMREAKHFYETPAAVVTLDQADILATGAADIFEALRFADGVAFHEQLPHGQFFSTMVSRNIIRGSQYGTLMLVDGMPANNNGFYFTGDIPVQVIKSTEVVRGAASSLYGADAAGGLINIITGHPGQNSASVTLGDYSYRQYSFALRQNWNLGQSAGGVSAAGVYQNHGSVKRTSDSGTATGNDYEFGGSIRRTARVMLSQGPWSVSWLRSHTVNKAIAHKKAAWVTDWSPAGEVTIYDDALTNDYIRANGHGENWSANLFANLQEMDWKNIFGVANAGITADKPAGYVNSGADIKGKVLGGDFQYQLKFDHPRIPQFLFGATYIHESVDNTDYSNGAVSKYDRDSIGVFARAAETFYKINDYSLTASLALRESYYDRGNIYAFTPQFQLLQTFPHRLSVYANIGRSFSVASLRTLYVSGPLTSANPDLDPDTGWTCEVGVKWEGSRTLASLDIFYMDFDHLLSWKSRGSGADKEFYADNAPFRNPGIEFSVAQKIGSAFTIEAGAVYNEPEQQNAANKKWLPVIGKVQASLRARWAWDRYSASFNVAFLGDRKNPASSGAVIYKTGEMAPATLKAGVSFGKFGALSAAVDNLFDRRDIVNHPTSASKYYATPRSFRVTYEFTF